uniref:Uncharacterized protein n=1 Tax=Romanomermis culicivorax TaxID=13658 RepID=A0A915ITR8_ROMCU
MLLKHGHQHSWLLEGNKRNGCFTPAYVALCCALRAHCYAPKPKEYIHKDVLRAENAKNFRLFALNRFVVENWIKLSVPENQLSNYHLNRRGEAPKFFCIFSPKREGFLFEQ